MIVCVVEMQGVGEGDNSPIAALQVLFVDTDLAVSPEQRAYVDAIGRAFKGGRETDVEPGCSFLLEDGDEISRMTVKLPQRIDACVMLRLRTPT